MAFKKVSYKHTHDYISVKGARENNLQNISLDLPKNQLIVFTGLSGSGKSSLAFDTIYAEGQRRYVESLSSYARQFLGNNDKPDVDAIEGLSPAISIDQKTTSHNPRSTVGTVTEIYDYLRLLFARIGIPFCPNGHGKIETLTTKQIASKIATISPEKRIQLLAPMVKNARGSHSKLFDDLRREGFLRVRIDGRIYSLDDEINLEKNKKHSIEVVIDRIIMHHDHQTLQRIYEACEVTLQTSQGQVLVVQENREDLYSVNYACDVCDFSLPELEPRLFSFNSPLGACEECKGLGSILEADFDLLVPDKNLSIREEGIIYYRRNVIDSMNIEWQQFTALLNHYEIDLDKPIRDFTAREIDIIMAGSTEPIQYKILSRSGHNWNGEQYIEGIGKLIKRRYFETESMAMRTYYNRFLSERPCPSCNGDRLGQHAKAIKINELNICEFTKLTVSGAMNFLLNLKLTEQEQKIANLALKEILNRLTFLNDVGLNYLTLARTAATLSGGEAQRIRLATQIGSQLTGVLYVLDEPSIGLHQRDNRRLIKTLQFMRNLGNTLIVVEHDEETILSADHIVDIGPFAGEHGGKVVAAGNLDAITECKESVTGDYLVGRKFIPLPEKIQSGNGVFLEVLGARANNLKNLNVKFPLGKLICVTGVSGSGKSTLVNEILAKSLARTINRATVKPGLHKRIHNATMLDKVVVVTQSPIGRTPRSNPATYADVFTDIRDLFASSIEAQVRGYKPGRFSFNVPGGRCERCHGDGTIRISMQFLPDVYIQCEECQGRKYNHETLQIKWKGKNIFEVLQMTIEEALVFFEKQPRLQHKLRTLNDVGLNYIRLGQAATELSGGEAQRVKLAKFLQKKSTGRSLYILDEPTTGLHMADVGNLVKIFQQIVASGNTVVVIEHNLDVIKVADHIIDLGPEGGEEGGRIIVTGTPEEVASHPASYTGKYLKQIIIRDRQRML